MRGWAASVVMAFAALRVGAAPVTCARVGSMAALLGAWTRAYDAAHPEAPVRLTVTTPFSAGAFDALLRGEVQIAPFARELFPSEARRYQARFGRPVVLVPVALGSRDTKGGTHAIAIFVNANNPLARLTVPQLVEILADGGRIRNWGDLGLDGPWANRPIVVHGMTRRRSSGDPPGIVNFLEQRLLAGRRWRSDLVTHADSPNGPQALELIVRAVAADDAAIGYSGFGYVRPGAKALALASFTDGPFWRGNADEVARADYPLTRRIYLCLSAAPTEEARSFVEFVESAAGQACVRQSAGGFFPLPTSEITAARLSLAKL